MVDVNGEPLRDKNGDLRYKTYYGMQSTQRGSRYALFSVDTKDETPEAVETQSEIKDYVASYNAHQHLSKAAIENLATLELALRDDFNALLLKNKRLTAELQNIQRTKDFILCNIKQKPNMPAAELHAFIHELKEIKAILETKKTTVATKPAAVTVDGELLSRLGKLKKLIQVGFHVLLNSSKSSEEEKIKFDELSNQINDILNLPKDVTNSELQTRIETLAAAKVFLDKWLPEIAQRQGMTFFNSSEHAESEPEVVTSLRHNRAP